MERLNYAASERHGLAGEFKLSAVILSKLGTEGVFVTRELLRLASRNEPLYLVGGELFNGMGLIEGRNYSLMARKICDGPDFLRLPTGVAGALKIMANRPNLDLDLLVADSDLLETRQFLQQGVSSLNWQLSQTKTGIGVLEAKLDNHLSVSIARADQYPSFRNKEYSTNYDALQGRIVPENNALVCRFDESFWQTLGDPETVRFINLPKLKKADQVNPGLLDAVIVRAKRMLITRSLPDGTFLQLDGGSMEDFLFMLTRSEQILARMYEEERKTSLDNYIFANALVCHMLMDFNLIPIKFKDNGLSSNYTAVRNHPFYSSIPAMADAVVTGMRNGTMNFQDGMG